MQYTDNIVPLKASFCFVIFIVGHVASLYQIYILPAKGTALRTEAATYNAVKKTLYAHSCRTQCAVLQVIGGLYLPL